METDLITDYLEGAKEPYLRHTKTAKKIENKFHSYYSKKEEKYSEFCRWHERICLHELCDQIIDLCKKDCIAAQHNYLKIFYNVIFSFDPNSADWQFEKFFEWEDDFETIADWDIYLFGKIAI